MERDLTAGDEIADDWRARIVVDPAILAGKPIIRGTRLAVEFVLDLLAGGWSLDEVTGNYPGITGEDVRACLRYANDLLKAERAYPLNA